MKSINENRKMFCRIFLTAVPLLCFTTTFGTPLTAQTMVSLSAQHAVLEHTSNGKVSITAQGPWSLEQAVARLRREYGWVVDYEESIPAPNNLIRRSDGRSALRRRVISVSIPAPANGSSAAEQATLQSLAEQLNSTDYPGYKVLNVTPTTTPPRFDITQTGDGRVVPLNTLITLPKGEMPVSRAIDEILAAVQAKTGYPIVRGGLAEGELDRVSVTFDGASDVPARVLLAEALDAAHEERVWLLTYDPTMSSFGLGIEPAVRITKTPSGQGITSGVVRQKVQ